MWKALGCRVAGTIEPALAKRAESNVLVDRVRMVLEESRDRDEFPKMNEWSSWTQEWSAKLKYKKLTSRERQQDMFAIASELWEQLIREEEAGRISSFVRLSIADGVESSETRKDGEQYLELAMYMSCDQRLKNALEGKYYREAYAELSRRLDRDADVDLLPN